MHTKPPAIPPAINNFNMPRPRYAARIRLLLNLLLFAAIIAEHRGAAATGVVIDPELSSPSPFTTAPTASLPTAEPSPAPTTPNSVPKASVADSKLAYDDGSTTTASNVLDVNAYAVNGIGMDTKNVLAAVADDDSETVETDYQLPVAAPTPPASVEQQDQPLVPPTTLSFANIAPASGLDSDLYNSGGGGGGSITGFEFGEGDGKTATTSGDATPPYAAVDEKYGKYANLNAKLSNFSIEL